MASTSAEKNRCEQCNLLFWLEMHLLELQLNEHALTHKRCRMFNGTYCQKGFARGDRLFAQYFSSQNSSYIYARAFLNDAHVQITFDDMCN